MCDSSGYRFGILLDLAGGESQYSPAVMFQISFALKIGFARCIVVTPIDLDHDPFRYARKVGKVWADGVFSSKLQPAELACSEDTPQQTFRLGFGFSQLSSANFCRRRRVSASHRSIALPRPESPTLPEGG